MSNPARKAIVLAAGLFFFCGCQKFKSQRRADFAPFAEQTIASISQLDADLGRQRRILTVKYMQAREETLDMELRPLIDRLQSIKRYMVEYSLVVARLTKPGKTEQEQVAELVTYMKGLRHDLEKRDTKDGFLSAEELDAIIANVEVQQTALHALEAAQPLINSVALVTARAASKIRGIIAKLEKSVSAEIESDFAGLIRFGQDYRTQRDLLLGGLEEIYRHRDGDADALKRLRTSGAIPAGQLAALETDGPLGDEEIEEHLMVRFERLNRVAAILRPEIERYRALQLEWDGMIKSFDGELRELWGVIFVWTRAHDRLARGIVDPAEWFDIKDAPAAIFGIAKKAIL